MKYTNERLLQICKREDIIHFIRRQQQSYLGHVARYSDSSIVKQLVYNANKYGRCGQPPITLESQVLKNTGLTREQFYVDARKKLEKRSAGSAEMPVRQIR